jgi:hypothetical protein
LTQSHSAELKALNFTNQFLRLFGKRKKYGDHVQFSDKCAIYGQMCHLWANAPFIGKCAIYGQICHFWANVPFIGKCDIFGQM